MTNSLRVAVIGAGFAGQGHAMAWRIASIAPDLAETKFILDTVIDTNLPLAQSVATRYGFTRASDNLDAVIADPQIQAFSVALPNHLAAPVLTKLMAAGKHVLSEKPLGRNATEAAELARLAEQASGVTAVNFSYRRIPGLASARKAVLEGRIGTPYFARGFFYADYALDPATPMAWRYDRDFSGGGTLTDMGAHVVDSLESMIGDVEHVLSSTFSTSVAKRSAREGTLTPVTNEDTALLNVRFAGGALGSIVASRVAAGAPCEMGVEVFGSKGHVKFTTDDFNRFTLFLATGDPEVDGPRQIFSGPHTPHFTDVAAMANHGVATGYNEAFAAQVQVFVRAIVTGEPMDTTFAAAARTMAVLDDAAVNAGATTSPAPPAPTQSTGPSTTASAPATV